MDPRTSARRWHMWPVALAATWLFAGIPAVALGAARSVQVAAHQVQPDSSREHLGVALRSQMHPVFEQRSRDGGTSSGQAVPRGSSGGGGSTSSGGSSGGTATTRSSGGSTGSGTAGGGTRSDGSGDTSYSRPRNGRPASGQAVERPSGGNGPIVIPPGGYWGGYYPWGWGGLGFAGYYGFYDPWWYGGGYPIGGGGGYVYGTEGAVKLKVKPRQAEVFVDGYFAGAVDDYDGTFQRLRLDPGPHRIEIRMDGYEPLLFEVRIQPDKTITYRSEMRKAN